MLLKKANKKRRYTFRKKRTTTTKMSTAMVARIAKSVSLRAAETKSFLGNLSSTNQGDDVCRVWNLNYPITQGVTSTNVLGEKIHLTNIRIQGLLRSNVASSEATRIVRMLVFRTKKQLASTTAVDITATDLYRSNVNVCSAQVDLHKVDLLHDQYIKLQPTIEGKTVQTNFVINIPINKTEYFDEDNSGFFKNKSYYLAFHHYDGNAITPPSQMYCTYALNFKDE